MFREVTDTASVVRPSGLELWSSFAFCANVEQAVMGGNTWRSGESRWVSHPATSERHGDAEWEILEGIARGLPASGVLHDIIELIERHTEDVACALLIHDESEGVLRHGAASRLPEELRGAFDGVVVGPSGASCGISASRRERVIVEDIESHPHWINYKQSYLQNGLRAAWSNPILSPTGAVLGTLELYCRDARAPTVEECARADAAAHLASLALMRAEVERDHKRLLDDLRERVKELTLLQQTPRQLSAGRGDTRQQLQQDRTEQEPRATPAELDASQRLELQANRMPLAYIVWDGHCRVTEWNGAAERIFGWTAAEAVGRHARELMMRVDDEALQGSAPHDALHDDAAYTGGVHENVRKSGERLVCEWFHALLRDATGKVNGHLSMANDITERKLAEEERNHLEAQLRQAQRIQSLGTLVGGIAHDFNNILTAIAGHAHLALLDLEEERSTKESLLAIQEAGLRAVEVVSRLLTFSRHRPPERKVVPLEPIAEQALQMLRATLSPSITIRSRFDPTAPDVHVDGAQVQQVLMNLGVNAAYAMGERGDIDVSVETVPAQQIGLPGVAESSTARYVKVSVSDSGCGMDAATLERIFEPFFTTKPTGQGTGLGLSVVHGIVQSHEGLLSVQSKPGQGSVFCVYFPEAATPDGSTRRERPRSGIPASGGRLLYVDDEEPLVVLAKRWLGRLGYQVTGFCDSSLALEAFRARPFDFDAVVSDFAMPGVPGLELVREIMAIRPDIPVVMSSGYLRPEDRRLAQLAGAGDVLLKPHSMAEFAQVLHRTLVGRSAAPKHGVRS